MKTNAIKNAVLLQERIMVNSGVITSPRTQGRLPRGDAASLVHTESVCFLNFFPVLCKNIKTFIKVEKI